MNLTIPQQCLTCVHLHEKGMLCDAFPEAPGIPQEIADMEFDHRSPYPGDQGVRWEPKNKSVENPFDAAKKLAR